MIRILAALTVSILVTTGFAQRDSLKPPSFDSSVTGVTCCFGDIIEPDTTCSGITVTDTVICNNHHCFLHYVYDLTDAEPSYPGGWEDFQTFVDTNLHLGADVCYKGTVYVTFIVEVLSLIHISEPTRPY